MLLPLLQSLKTHVSQIQLHFHPSLTPTCKSKLTKSKNVPNLSKRSKHSKTVQNDVEIESCIPNPFLRAALKCFGTIFSNYGPSWTPSWAQFGSQVGTKIDKITIPKSIKILTYFKIDFLVDFGRFLSQHGPKLTPKSNQKWMSTSKGDFSKRY